MSRRRWAAGLFGTVALAVLAAAAVASPKGSGTDALPRAPEAPPMRAVRVDPGPAGRVSAASVPVLLVPGWLDTGREMAALRLRLIGSGWPGASVETLTFRDATGSNRDHAAELEEAVRSLLAGTGADRVDIVAHSMGGLATRWYLASRPDAPVRRVVFIASPHRGTLSAHLSWGGGRREMMPESAFLDTLNARAPAPEGVETITISTSIDTHVVPGESATLPGVRDHRLCCPTHAGLLRDDEAFFIVRRFLEGGESP